MTTLSKSRVMPLLAALVAVIFLGGAIGAKFGMKLLRRWLELNKRRKERLALVASTPNSAAKPKIQHVILYSLANLADGSPTRNHLDKIVEKMNGLPGCKVSFSTFGTKALSRQALLSFLGKPDMSCGLTHCLYIVAEQPVNLREFFHSTFHKQEWYATGGPHYRWCVEVTTDLAVDLEPDGKEDPVLDIIFLKFHEHVTDDSEVYANFLKIIAEFSKYPGIVACLRPAGHHTLIKKDFLNTVKWVDTSFGMTHVLTIAADSPQHLKDLMSSEAYSRWLATEMPHLQQQDGQPPAFVFFAPLKASAKR